MNIVVLGSSGSLAAPGNPASGYLITRADGRDSVVLDMGPGVLARLQEEQDPARAHVVFSHLHPDHCLDFPSLVVWRRYHPTARPTATNLCVGPSYTVEHLGRLCADFPEVHDDLSDTFEFRSLAGGTVDCDGLVITPYPAVHPVESYSLRIEDPATGLVIAYSGDTAYTEALVDCARGAHTFLCEATWGATSDGKADDMHLSGQEAGRIARLAGVGQLVLTHIPPWAAGEEALAAARAEFAGPVLLARPGMTITNPVV